MSEIALLFGKGLQVLGLFLSPILLVPLVSLAFPSLTQHFNKLKQSIDCLGKILMNIAGWSGFIMAAGMLIAVLMRYVFGLSFSWVKDIWIYAFATCFMFASAGALRTGGHVRVDIFYSKFSEKQRAIVDLIGAYLLLFPLMLLVLYAYGPQLARAWGALSGRMELSSQPDGLPLLFLFKTLVPIFAVTMILQGWANCMRAVAIIKNIPIEAAK
ncbi:TRAP transporter small permease subunit [Hirschia litorea]|uniref:TRAP transporter small permease protein n=1 Tax=Hirschia litorea TaxID=1199156 RepID=A0ABW2IIQ8_9PROT